MLAGRYVDTRAANAVDRYGREVTPAKKGAKREFDRIKRWQADPLASKSLAALRGSDIGFLA